MKKTILKSIGAIAAGFFTTVILSVVADMIMSATGLMNIENFKATPTGIILVVTLYRFVFNVIGCYVAARLAPQKPMKHAVILGSIGLALSIMGVAAMWDKAVLWYNLAIVLMALPCAYFGGKLYKPKAEN